MNQNFFTELISRLGQKNPKFFDIIQVVALALGAVSAGFHYLDTSGTVLPSWLHWLESSTVWITSAVAAVVAQLPNQNLNQPKV